MPSVEEGDRRVDRQERVAMLVRADAYGQGLATDVYPLLRLNVEATCLQAVPLPHP